MGRQKDGQPSCLIEEMRFLWHVDLRGLSAFSLRVVRAVGPCSLLPKDLRCHFLNEDEGKEREEEKEVARPSTPLFFLSRRDGNASIQTARERKR